MDLWGTDDEPVLPKKKTIKKVVPASTANADYVEALRELKIASAACRLQNDSKRAKRLQAAKKRVEELS